MHLGRSAAPMPPNFAALVARWEQKELPLLRLLAQCGKISEAAFYRRLRELRALGKK